MVGKDSEFYYNGRGQPTWEFTDADIYDAHPERYHSIAELVRAHPGWEQHGIDMRDKHDEKILRPAHIRPAMPSNWNRSRASFEAAYPKAKRLGRRRLK